jgi:hypothetical protein
MRTSVGFFDTGTSGKMRIQTRPARFIWRVIARRAASIWRAVTRSGSSAFRPNAEVQVGAALRDAVDAALELLAELGALRLQHDVLLSFRRSRRERRGRGRARRPPRAAGRSAIAVLRLSCHRVVLEDLALEDPDLDAAGAVGGERRRAVP